MARQAASRLGWLRGQAARRLRLTTLSFLQYLSPSLQLLLAVAVFGEPFPAEEIARLREVPVETIASATSTNFFRLFRVDPHAQ